MIIMYVFFFIFIILIFILFIIILINFINKNNSSNNFGFLNDLLINYDNIIWNYVAGSDKLSQERLTVLSQFNYNLTLNNQNVNYSIIKTLNDNYDKSTENWYTKNIGIPKYFILSLWENQNYVFKDAKNINNNITALLNKIFSIEQDIRDDLVNGYDVILYNIMYINLQKKYNLKEYDCHKNKNYMDKINNILQKKFTINQKWSGTGFYNDNSFIYHDDISYNTGYLRELIQDIYYIDKYKLYDYNTNNKNIILNYFKPFIYGNFTNYNTLGRGLTRERTKKDMYYTIFYLNSLYNNIFINDIKYFYQKSYISHNFYNENKKYLMPISGSYMWYDKNYDNYIINGYNTYIKPEIVTDDNDGDLLIKNCNYYSNILFGDENLFEWFQNVNTVNSQLILSGCLVDENEKILNTQGWLTSIYKEIVKNIDIVIFFINNLETKILIYYIIDKNLKIVTLNIVFEKIMSYKIYPVSIYQNSPNITYNKINNIVSVLSLMKPRYVITDLPNQDVNLETRYSKNNFCRIKYDLPNLNNLIYLSTNYDYKLPNVIIKNNTLEYNNLFTIENNVKTFKNFEKFEMLCITKKNEKIYIYADYPYDKSVPDGFIIDSEYRCYMNK